MYVACKKLILPLAPQIKIDCNQSVGGIVSFDSLTKEPVAFDQADVFIW